MHVTHGLWTDVTSWCLTHKIIPQAKHHCHTMYTDTESVGVAGDDTTHHHRGKRKYNNSSLIYVTSATVAAAAADDDWNANNTTFPPTAALSRDDPNHNNKRRRPPNRQHTSIQYSRISVSLTGGSSGSGIGVISTVDSDPSNVNDTGLRMPQQQNLPQEYIANQSNYYDNNTFTIVNQERRVTLLPPPP
jgi:hypothetical protein